MKALILHPNGDYMGNLRWTGEIPEDLKKNIEISLEKLRSLGYWASLFPEGDGITFNVFDGGEYDPNQALCDFRECFSFMEIVVKQEGKTISEMLASIAGSREVVCRYLVPISGMSLLDNLTLGDTKLHRPVDGDEVTVATHAWGMDLSDEPGAEVNHRWVPSSRSTGTSLFLRFPLIERMVKVEEALLYEAAASVRGQEKLLCRILHDAELALAPIRFVYCNYRRLEYLSNKAGWIGEFAHAYLMPKVLAFPAKHITAKPTVLRVENNWLGLEVGNEVNSKDIIELISLVDLVYLGEVADNLRAGLRALNNAFYLVDLEAAFLSIIYATDAVVNVGNRKGEQHRDWVCAAASWGNAHLWGQIRVEFSRLYTIRNGFVHKGESFSSLNEDAKKSCDFMLRVLALSIKNILTSGITNFSALDAAIEFHVSALRVRC